MSLDFLAGTKILEEIESPINGKIRVVRNLAFGTHIQVNNLTQSGGVVEDIWRGALRQVKSQKLKVKSCLILGFGGGTAAKLVRKFWPDAEIVGVDIDPIMVEMGKKYLGLDKVQVQVQIEDATEFVRVSSKSKRKFDLILIDLYVGQEYPKRFESDLFLRLVLRLMTKKGVAVFNRLYYGEKRPEALKFGKKLEKVFSKVEYFYPEANLMFLCYNK